MTVTAEAASTQTAVIGTEHTLDDVAAAGTYTLHVDTVNMAAADVLELRVYQIVLTGGTRRVAYFARYRITDFNIRFNQSGMSEVSTPYRPRLRFICNSPTHTLAGGDVKMGLDGVLVVNSVRPTIEPNSGAAMQVGYYSNGQLTNEVRFGDLRHAVRP
jgi:hypothetical protein